MDILQILGSIAVSCHSYHCFNFSLSDFHFVPESWVLIELGSMGSVPEIQF